MSDAKTTPSHFKVVVADPNWDTTENLVADAYIVGDDVCVEPCEGMYVEDEEGLKSAIKRGETKFQEEGYSMHEAYNLPPSAPVDDKTRINAWRYLIVPVEKEQ